MNAKIGSVTLQEKSVISGSGHIIAAYPVADGLKGLSAGTAVKLDSGKVGHLATDADDAIGILYNAVTTDDSGKTKEATAQVVVFGSVKKESVTYTESATACTETLVERLRKNGLYAL